MEEPRKEEELLFFDVVESSNLHPPPFHSKNCFKAIMADSSFLLFR
jgi:hypothetical protein